MLFNQWDSAPTCINHGCGRPVTYSGTNKQGRKRYRPVCGHCHTAGRGAGNYAPGVTPFRTGVCSNIDGHLGWVCFIDWSRVQPGMVRTEIDHIDGNHMNNTPDNCQEVCSICHMEKGRRNGDLRGYRYDPG